MADDAVAGAADNSCDDHSQTDKWAVHGVVYWRLLIALFSYWLEDMDAPDVIFMLFLFCGFSLPVK